MFKRLINILLFIWLACPASGQNMDSLAFVNIGVKDGLSNNAVTCLLQDHYGFIWMGTYDGLNRYDGTNFRIFRNQLQDSVSLVNNHITVLKEGVQDRIWVGTLKGLSCFDYRDFKFHKAYYQPGKESGAIAMNARVRDLLADSAGHVLVATENYGLLVKKKTAAVFQQVAWQGRTTLNITAICPYENGQYFVYIKDQGLFVYHLDNNTLTLFSGQVPGATRLLYEMSDRRLLIGTEDGLFNYQMGTGALSLFSPALANCNITHLLRDKAGTLWVSTDGSGLAMVRSDNDLPDIHFIKQGRDQYHLESAAVYGVYEDNSGRKWVATLRGGTP